MSKKQKFIDLVCQICDDNSHGYDQANRWGPDFDCTSLCYYCANKAGYNIKTGSGYSGTLRNDFTKAGWTAKVFDGNINNLQPGTIMLREGHHAEVVISANQWGGAHINENGGIVGGRTGDQTGNEIARCKPYHYGTYPNDWDYLIIPPAEQESAQPESNAVNNMGIKYSAHCQDHGWLPEVHDGQIAGTVGRAKRLEALKIDASAISGLKLHVKAHIQNVGWKDFGIVDKDTIIGTIGQSKRIEAIQIEAEGLPTGKNLCYSVQIEQYGWLGFIQAPYTAGTVGIGKRIEAIKIQIA